ncbi:hypothetical protein BZG36_01912 [Bifiguratus adelaidae]|uniref:BRCT domain-containing protein n=1 Tax=Bifiguratus adelaidae TaxID=1938954 RepID=A0A261Y4H3_9FUNG|nr:hypothetical protein BZG36_01912 [Bifiguratus adelaidae]
MAVADTSVQFTVGKLDAGMAILLTEDHHLIEFPSLLLPSGVSSGSIVNISVHRNVDEEGRQLQEFWDLQELIINQYGKTAPQPPVLRTKSVTQTSIVLEWDPLELDTAQLRALEIYKNKTKLAQHHVDPSANQIKLSGLDVDHEYEFYLVLKTSAGAFTSNTVTTRTHKMENLTGINLAFGSFEEREPAISDLKALVEKVGAEWTEDVTSDTTHLVAQVPGGANYEKALGLSIPIVKPEWLIQCEKQGKMQAALPYYLVNSGQ